MEAMLTILIVEDVATDAELICMELESAPLLFTCSRVETKEDFIAMLTTAAPDIIISDFTLPRFSALEALKLRNEINCTIPFVLVTGNQTEEIAVDCLKQGADDYILKSSLTRLPSAIQNALQKKKAEEAAIKAIEETKAREEKYRNLFENSLVGMFRASIQDCRFMEANEKTKQILGVSTLEGLFFDDFSFCNESGKLSDLIRGGQQRIEGFELQVHRPDQTPVWISISARLYKAEGFMEGVILDITYSKSSFIELEKANYELDRFSYHASHDIRAPLQSLEGLIKAALEENDPVQVRKCLELMQRSTAKLNNLIRDLLTLARNKKSEAKPAPVDFDRELQDTLLQVAFLENYKRIRIETTVLQNHSFFTDAVRLGIILNNVISNAIKYHRVGQHDPFIQVDIVVNPDNAFIVIADNGNGIGEKHLVRIFDMFYRADTKSEGSGLGLYLVKTTVEKLAGNISVHSEEGTGTTFFIEIPNQKEISAEIGKNKVKPAPVSP